MARARQAPRLVILGVAIAAACAHAPAESFTSDAHLRNRWLPPLEDGVTTRGDVVASLGEPTTSFEARRILGYRLMLVERSIPLLSSAYRELVPPGFLASGARIGTDARREALARNGRLVVARPRSDDQWLLSEVSREAEYSLVLVFDGEVLRQHSLARVLP